MSSWFVVLTGGIGSGKSLAASYFHRHGITIIEQDDISREVVKPGKAAYKAIVQRFGSEILNEHNELDRPQLRRRIFNDDDDKKWLEQLLHPLIGQYTMHRLQTASSRYAIVVNPLLHTRQAQYDRFVVVDTPVEIQIQRAMQRDGMTRELAQKMVASQTDREHQLRLADDVIVNQGSKDIVEAQVDRLHHRYLVMAC